MAAKRVLGNDPFKRGAAPRVPVATKPVLTPQAERKATPEMQTVQAPKAPLANEAKPTAPLRPSKKSKAIGPPPPVRARAAAEPVAHAEAPSATGLGKQPAPHFSSPSLSADPVPHAGAPSATGLGTQPAPHFSSPSLSADPVPHAGAPSATGLGKQPASHFSSPSVWADPIPHAAAPSATGLGAEPASHFSSPTLASDPVRHDATPEAFSLGREPVAHAAAPEVVPPTVRPPPEAALTERPQTPVQLSPSLLSRDGAIASVKGVAGALRAVIGRSGKDTRVDAYGRDEALVQSLQPLADALYEKYWRVTLEGVADVPAGASVLVANHAGALPIDGPLLHHALKRERPDLLPARWLLEDQLFHSPGLGVLWNRIGAVRASPENAMQLLAEHTPIVVFPEGFQGLSKPFAQRYQLQRFGRGGYVKIAARAGVPIVPVAIVGAEESVPLLAKLPAEALGIPFLPLTLPPLPARWFIKFGTPIVVEGGAAAATDLALVQKLNEQVRDTIDVMLKDLLSRRDGVF